MHYFYSKKNLFNELKLTLAGEKFWKEWLSSKNTVL